MVLDLVPERRGMASSLQAFIGSTANGLVAGVVAPLVMHSAVALAATSLAMMSIGVIAWLVVKPHMRPAAASSGGAAERVAATSAAAPGVPRHNPPCSCSSSAW